MSVEEYLRLEDAATEKHEYRNGYRYLRHARPYGFEAMAGAREPRVRMAMRVARLLDEHLDDSPCIVYGANMRLATDDDAYFYPEVFVTGNPRTGPNILAQHDATAVMEILSPGTEGDDRGDESHHYQHLPSLEEYVLLSMDEPHADLFQRGHEGLWVLRQVGAADELALESLEFRAPMDRLYRGIGRIIVAGRAYRRAAEAVSHPRPPAG